MSVSVPFIGGCACGAIRYACSAEPLFSWKCHCRDCQRASGGGFAVNAIVPAAALTFTRGAPQYYRVASAAGRTRELGFCSTCGSPVGVKNAAFPDVFSLSASSLDDPEKLTLVADVWTTRAQPWDYMHPALSKFQTQPTEEELQEMLSR